jgi:tryptophanyl-tRNA synthetase
MVGEMVVNPWEATGNMNYDKLIEQFGSQAISPALIDRFERVTGKRAHTWIRVR